MKVIYTTSEKLEEINQKGIRNELQYEGFTTKGILLIEICKDKDFRLHWISPRGDIHHVTNDISVLTPQGLLDFRNNEFNTNDSKSKYHHISQIGGKFLTILRSEEAYLSILSVLEKSKFFNALNSLKEYVYLSKNKPETNFLNEFSQNSFFREELSNKQLKYLEEKGYERFINKFIHPGQFSDFDFTNIEIKHRLSGVGELKVDFDFNQKSIFPSNIKAMIGKNGVGKSQTLRAIKDFALNNQTFKKVVAINVFQTINRTSDPSYSSLRTDFSTRINTTSSVLHLLKHRRKYQYFNTFEILEELFIKHFGCDDVFLLVDGELRSLFHLWTANISLIDTSSDLIPFKKGGKIKLSTGQEYLLSMTLLLLLHVNQYSCVLIDEPELYLHPNLIVSFKKILETIMQKSHSVAFLSTHSVFLIRELPKESVVVIYEQDGKPLSRKIYKETFGASLDSLASQIFYDEEIDNSFDEFVTDYKAKHENVKIEDLRSVPTSLAMRILSK